MGKNELVKNYNVEETITLKDFFCKLDEYLIGDLKEMTRVKSEEESEIGYPCLMTILSGMELLGFLISGNKSEAFDIFWYKFQERFPQYRSDELRKVFRQAIRNGIAHGYLIKKGIYVHNKNPEWHLHPGKVENSRQIGLIISCKALFDDFESIYEEIKNDLLVSPEKAYLSEVATSLEEGNKYVQKFFESDFYKNGRNKKVVVFKKEEDINGVSHKKEYISA